MIFLDKFNLNKARDFPVDFSIEKYKNSNTKSLILFKAEKLIKTSKKVLYKTMDIAIYPAINKVTFYANI